jgi:hypothetical protein
VSRPEGGESKDPLTKKRRRDLIFAPENSGDPSALRASG